MSFGWGGGGSGWGGQGGGGGGPAGASADELARLELAEKNLGVNFLRDSIAEGWSIFGMVDGFADVYSDVTEAGINTGASTGQTYNSGGEYYTGTTTSTHSLLIQSEETGTASDGSAYFYDSSGTTKGPLTVGGSAQTEIPDEDSPYADKSSLGMSFNGTSSSVVVDGSGTDTDFDMDAGDFTLEAWVKPSSLTGARSILSQLGASDWGWDIYWNGSNVSFGVDADGNGSGVTLATGGTLSLNTWTHVAGVRDVNTLRLYVGGVQVATKTAVNAHNADADVRVGSRDNGTNRWGGLIADAIVRKGVCSYPNGTTFAPATTKPAFGSEELFVSWLPAGTNVSDGNSKTLINYNVGAELDPYFGTDPVLLLNSATNDYVSLADSADLQIGSDDFKFGFWCKPNGASGTNQQIVYKSAGAPNKGIQLRYNGTTGILTFEVSSNGTSALISPLSATTALVAGVWAYVELIQTSDTITWYVDGVSSGSTAFTGSVNDDPNAFLLGYTASNLSFSGKIADFQLFIDATSVPASSVPSSKPVVSTENLYLEHDIDKTDGWGNATASIDATGTHNVTANGGLRHTLSDSKFGLSSMSLDGVDSKGTLPYSTDWDFGTGDFTIEMWYNPASTGPSTRNSLVATTNAGNSTGYYFWINAGEMYFQTPSTTYMGSSGLTWTADTWYHLAVVRQGTDLSLYRGGTRLATVTNSTNFSASSQPLWIGSQQRTSYPDYCTGRIEEVSIVKGTARYDATQTTITVPTSPYALGFTNMTLIGATQTANSAPTSARMVVLYDPIDASTLNTDCTLELSMDGGVTYSTPFVLEKESDYDANVQILTTGDLTLDSTSGTSMVYRFKTLNSKVQRLHGVYVQWR